MSLVVRAARNAARLSLLLSVAPLFACSAAPSSDATTVNVFVTLSEPPLARAAGDAQAQFARIVAEQDRFLAAVQQHSVKVTILYRVQRALNGVALTVAPDRIDLLRTLPGVKRVEIVEPQQLNAAPDATSEPVHDSSSRRDSSPSAQ